MIILMVSLLIEDHRETIESGFYLLKAAKLENMSQRKIVKLEILYRTIYNTYV
jgi:hypothetical protein